MITSLNTTLLLVLLHCLLVVLGSQPSGFEQETCPLLCPPAYYSPPNCSEGMVNHCIQCPDGWHKSHDDRLLGFATGCNPNDLCNRNGQYRASTDKINGTVCACHTGYFLDSSDDSRRCKRCYCCDGVNSTEEPDCQTNTIMGAYCRQKSGTRLSNCRASPTLTSQRTTTEVTTEGATTTSTVLAAATDSVSTNTPFVMTSTETVSHSQHPSHFEPVENDDVNIEVVSALTGMACLVVVTAVVVSYVICIYKKNLDLTKQLQQNSVRIVDSESGVSGRVVYGLPTELRSEFEGHGQPKAQNVLRHRLNKEPKSQLLCPRKDDFGFQGSTRSEREPEPGEIESGDEDCYRDIETAHLPSEPLQLFSSSSDDSLTSFLSHEDLVHHATVSADSHTVSMNPNHSAVEELHVCPSSCSGAKSCLQPDKTKCTMHKQGRAEKIAKRHGIKRAVFVDQSLWDPAFGLLSYEDRKTMTYIYYGLQDPKCETIRGEESHLIALSSEVLWQLALRLDVPGPRNYRALAGCYLKDHAVVDYLQVEYMRWVGSPTLKLLKDLMAQEPPVEIEDLKQKLLDIERPDCAEFLTPCIAENGCLSVVTGATTTGSGATVRASATGFHVQGIQNGLSLSPRSEYLGDESQHRMLETDIGNDCELYVLLPDTRAKKN